MHANKYDPTGLTGIGTFLDPGGAPPLDGHGCPKGTSMLSHLVGFTGTNEKMLIRILTSVNRDNSGVRQVLEQYDDSFDFGWKEDLDYYATLPDITDIKNAYFKLEVRVLVFGPSSVPCCGNLDDTPAFAASPIAAC